jgi:hypothetical protein
LRYRRVEVVIMGTGNADSVERRQVSDRRTRTLHALAVGGVRGRRRHIRRQGPPRIAAIDWYPPQIFALVLLTLLLSCVDSLNTVALLNRGFIEVNPLMRELIDQGGPGFAVIKFSMTAVSMMALIALTGARAFGRFPVRSILVGALMVYVGLVVYEFWMLDGFTLFDSMA